MKIKIRWAAFAWLFASIGISNHAHATVTDTSFWNGFVFQGTLSKPWGIWVEEQLRLYDGWSSNPADPNNTPDSIKTRGNRFILRPALTYSVQNVPGLVFFLGAAWLPNLSPVRGEERIWEQVQYSHPLAVATMGHRLRLEHRHIDRSIGLAQRLRYRLQWARTGNDHTPWGWTLWDELFWNLNAVAGGPASGFDQNRFFVGPDYQIDRRSRVDVGYLQQRIAQGTARDSQLVHAFGLLMTVDFDK